VSEGPPSVRRRGGLADLVRLARPRQWTKNAVCFAALVFAGRLGDPTAVGPAVLIFVTFCLTSSTVYIINDLFDRAEDRAHPVKAGRALAAGRVAVGAALVEMALLAAGAIALSVFLVPRARAVLAAYLLLNLGYSAGLKRVAILDVMLIALGFVLRVQAGIEAIRARQSAWIILTMFFMALFLGFAKRRGELGVSPGSAARAHRALLGVYSVAFLDVVLAVSATTALVCYALYAVTVQPNEAFLVTVLPVVFGIVRYMMLVLVRERQEDPDELLTRDGPLVVAILIWAALSIAVLYLDLHLVPDAAVFPPAEDVPIYGPP